MNAADLFGGAPPPDPLIGQALCMSEPCRNCGTNVAVVCVARGSHTAGLKCRNCDAQWTAEIDFQILRDFIAEITSHFGAPAEIKLTTTKQRSEAMSDQQFDNTNRGALFKNTDKQSAKWADYRGEGNINGTDVWIDGWAKTSKNGVKFLSLRFKPKAEAAKKTTQAKPGPFDDDVSEIPF